MPQPLIRDVWDRGLRVPETRFALDYAAILQQMLAVARALARHPRLLLLDELSLGLAPVIVEWLLPVVRTFAQQRGCAVLLVEQHVHLALEVADRGYVLSHGQIVAHNHAEQLRDDRQLLVASYLGEQVHADPVQGGPS